MNPSEIPFQLDFSFDNYLREQPVSRNEMINAIEFMKKQLPNLQRNKKILQKHMVSLGYIQE
ncbi:hypothetical protein J9303_20540 [Bacillaceae bacterium Marseille-Q3522]|nr:hypothetical protein [Bacillaceae bacterium Marseille-Q3522]